MEKDDSEMANAKPMPAVPARGNVALPKVVIESKFTVASGDQ